jgi:hypothetical protein
MILVSRLLSGLWRLGLPACAPPQLARAARVFLLGAAVFWPFAALGARLAAAGAGTATVSAVICWASAARYDADRRSLILAFADLLDRVPADERPAQVRAVR